MSRNFDDVLRAWADEGEDFLPDVYLNAALDQAAGLPQHSARWAALRRLLPMSVIARSLQRPAMRLVAVAAAALLMVSIGVVAPSLDLGSLGTPRFSAADLEDIVTAAPPEGTSGSLPETGVGALIQAIRAYDVAPVGGEVMRVGFVDARVQVFTTWEPSRYMLSWAAVFESARGANDAFEIIRDSRAEHPADVEWMSAEPELGLGDAAVRFEPASSLGSERAYLWRSDNLLLFAYASGDVGAEDLRAIVAGMSSRAER